MSKALIEQLAKKHGVVFEKDYDNTAIKLGNIVFDDYYHLEAFAKSYQATAAIEEARQSINQSEPVAWKSLSNEEIKKLPDINKAGFFGIYRLIDTRLKELNHSGTVTPQQPQSVADALEEFAKEIKCLCNNYSSRNGSVYIGDVESSINELLKQHILIKRNEVAQLLIESNSQEVDEDKKSKLRVAP